MEKLIEAYKRFLFVVFVAAVHAVAVVALVSVLTDTQPTTRLYWIGLGLAGLAALVTIWRRQ